MLACAVQVTAGRPRASGRPSPIRRGPSARGHRQEPAVRPTALIRTSGADSSSGIAWLREVGSANKRARRARRRGRRAGSGRQERPDPGQADRAESAWQATARQKAPPAKASRDQGRQPDGPLVAALGEAVAVQAHAENEVHSVPGLSTERKQTTDAIQPERVDPAGEPAVQRDQVDQQGDQRPDFLRVPSPESAPGVRRPRSRRGSSRRRRAGRPPASIGR